MTYFLSGQWNSICDRCGFKFKSAELRKDWQGLMVCEKDYETRHPQDFIKVRPEKAIPDWTRPRTQDVFTHVCFVWESSGYADLLSADCGRADEQSLTYLELYSLSRGI